MRVGCGGNVCRGGGTGTDTHDHHHHPPTPLQGPTPGRVEEAREGAGQRRFSLGNCIFLALIGQDLHVIILEPIAEPLSGAR